VPKASRRAIRTRPLNSSIPKDPGTAGTKLQLEQDAALVRAGYWFSVAAADRFCEFCEGFLVHSKDRWAGQAVVLAPWQRMHLRRLFGWLRPDGTRRYTRTLWFLARKNGKSTIASAVGLYLMGCDGAMGARVYAVANDKDQAEFVFDEARLMVRASAHLSSIWNVYADSVFDQTTNSRFEAICAKPKHGFNPSGVIIDELHQFKKRDLWDAMTSAFGARTSPMEFVITTAGNFQPSLCHTEWEYAHKVIDGVIDAPEYLPVMYEMGDRDRWDDETAWRKANPNLGVSVGLEWLRQRAARAREDTGTLTAFQQLHCNRWVDGVQPWLDMDAWDRCGAAVDPETWGRRPVYGGLDLSKTKDLTAFVLVCPWENGLGSDALVWFWVPQAEADRRAVRDRAPYQEWIRDGYIRATAGNVVDYRVIERDVVEICSRFNVQEIGYDPWKALDLALRLQDDHGMTMVEMRQGFATMAAPTAELERSVLAGTLAHGAHPVLRWNASNTRVQVDTNGNMRPDKSDWNRRIDGIVALIMARGRSSVGADSTSVYESEGLSALF